jgi:GntR family transcriptional regulator, glc operon transcriptional activator
LVLMHMLAQINDLMLSTVFASVNNLYHREPQKRAIDRQHARLYNAETGRLPEQARRAASAHIRRVRVSRVEIEQDEQRLIRSTLRLEGWN